MCNQLRCMFPSTMVTSLISLHRAEITCCASLKTIFEIEKPGFGDTKIASSLRELHLLKLPNLKCVWRKDVVKFMTFPSLRRVKIDGCSKLTLVEGEH